MNCGKGKEAFEVTGLIAPFWRKKGEPAGMLGTVRGIT